VAFTIVSVAVTVLRRTAPDLRRSFKVPGYPVTPILSITGCLWIIKDLRPVTLLVLIVWGAVALIWYFTNSIKHSHLGRHEHVGPIHDQL
jgi:basic amino acid/polyamine antiporter, APA family